MIAICAVGAGLSEGHVKGSSPYRSLLPKGEGLEVSARPHEP